MQDYYKPNFIESIVRQYWKSQNIYSATEDVKNLDGSDKPKFYACSMLPYPSGKLHMGHVRNYVINDIIVRKFRMCGYNVLMPMGWDAFGIPAENAAIKSKISPKRWTYENIVYMKNQMLKLGLAIDWKREIYTCDPKYYKWSQWLFLKMFEKNIAYRKTQTVNWDPIDKTVLANEQVIDGRGWRSGALVEKREIPGYYLRITYYADRLLESIQKLSLDWPKRVCIMQNNWIGKSEGVRFYFPHCITDTNGSLIQHGKLYVFTTRIDTIMGVTFCSIAPEHPLAIHAAITNPKLNAFINQYNKTKNKSLNVEKISIENLNGISTGLTAIHPITGKSIEIWVSNYILMNYGEGAVMAVPAHNKHDFSFAKKYNLPINQVISMKNRKYTTDSWKEWYADKDNCFTINSDPYNGLTCQEAIRKITCDLEKMGFGEKKITWRLRDWGISRQRYWGTPIPIIHCNNCGLVPVPEKDLPVILPNHLVPNGTGNPLANCKEFIDCLCPKCGKKSSRETDTMDTFVDSSWYFMRYTSPNNDQEIFDNCNNYWMPIDQYIGGIEHAILHLLYSRFITKFLYDLGKINFEEPFKNLICQGMVLNHIYSRKTLQGNIEYFGSDDIKDVNYNEKGTFTGAKLKIDNSFVNYNGMGTMSKSKNNGIDPQVLIKTWGADTIRLFITFANAPEKSLEWSESGINGSYKFLNRLWDFCYKWRESIRSNVDKELDWLEMPDCIKDFRRTIHTILRKINLDYKKVQFNTVVSAAMKLLNSIEDITLISDSIHMMTACTEAVSILLRILHPIVPHITWQLWRDLKYINTFGDLLNASWPQPDENALITNEIKLVLQINGKRKGELLIPYHASEDDIKVLISSDKKIEKLLGKRLPKRLIIVSNKLVNIVI